MTKNTVVERLDSQAADTIIGGNWCRYFGLGPM
jgi:hypothetical protein